MNDKIKMERANKKSQFSSAESIIQSRQNELDGDSSDLSNDIKTGELSSIKMMKL